MRWPRILLILCLLTPGWACDPGSEAAEGGASLPDPAPRERIVVLTAGPVHLEPDTASPGVLEVPAGTLLDVVPGGAGETGWVRVATWDDRRGWLPANRLMEQSLWAHYGQALGGVAPSLLRPGYPVEGGVWAVEAPLGTPGITPASTAWLVGDSAVEARVTAIDSLEDICSEELHRFGILDARSSADNLPRLEEGRLVTPSGSRPATRRLTVGPLEPDAELAALLDSEARELAPPGVDPDAASVEWAALGTGSAWAALSWPAEDPSTGRAQFAAAIVFRRTPGGWERVATLGPLDSSAEIPTPAWRPAGVFVTGPSDFPTILLLEALEYEGAHLDIWIERGGRYERIYEGYYWGC